MYKWINLLLYMFYGAMTTLVNIVCYIISTKIWGINYIVATTISWIISVLFAFFCNKFLVFKSYDVRLPLFFREILLFFLLRLLSYLLDITLMIILVEKLSTEDITSKILTNIIVIILNYLLSKSIIFKVTKKANHRA